MYCQLTGLCMSDITPIEPIPDENFKPSNSLISVSQVNIDTLPESKDIDISNGDVFKNDYDLKGKSITDLSESSNQANILIEKLKKKQDELISKQAELITQVNTNTGDIETIFEEIEKIKEAIEKIEADIVLLFNPPSTELTANDTTQVPANGESLLLEFDTNVESKFKLAVSALGRLDVLDDKLAFVLKLNGSDKYTSKDGVFINFDTNVNNGKIELLLRNSSQNAIQATWQAFINIRGV